MDEQYNKRDMIFECVSENGAYLKSGYFMWQMMIKCEMSGYPMFRHNSFWVTLDPGNRSIFWAEPTDPLVDQEITLLKSQF